MLRGCSRNVHVPFCSAAVASAAPAVWHSVASPSMRMIAKTWRSRPELVFFSLGLETEDCFQDREREKMGERKVSGGEGE